MNLKIPFFDLIFNNFNLPNVTFCSPIMDTTFLRIVDENGKSFKKPVSIKIYDLIMKNFSDNQSFIVVPSTFANVVHHLDLILKFYHLLSQSPFYTRLTPINDSTSAFNMFGDSFDNQSIYEILLQDTNILTFFKQHKITSDLIKLANGMQLFFFADFCIFFINKYHITFQIDDDPNMDELCVKLGDITVH